MITNKWVSVAIDYIMEHLDEELSVEAVAEHCHLSQYYFSRVFKAETGEGIYAFIKRVRMEQSALSLKIEKDRTVTDIGMDYGYSPSNYSTVFKKHHKKPPAEFRRGLNSVGAPNPFYPEESGHFQSFDTYGKDIKIQELDDFHVVYERHIGNYSELGDHWRTFIGKYSNNIMEDTLLIERSYDDPSITGLDQCLYDICITVDANCPLENTIIIKGGRFAVCRFDGFIRDCFTAFQGMVNCWFPYSGYEMDERYVLGIYRDIDWENQRIVMDICIPIK